MDVEVKSHNVFAELALSCYSIDSYQSIRKNKFGKRFLYHLILTVILFFLAYGVSYTRFVLKEGGVQGTIEKYVPDFELTKDGYLELERPVEMIESNAMVIADTDSYFDYEGGTFYQYDPEIDDWLELGSVGEYTSVILIDSEQLIAYSTSKGYQTISFDKVAKELGGFNRQKVIDFCNAFVPFVGVFLFVCTFIAILWSAFLNSVILLIVASVKGGTVLPYMELYTISLYAMTPFKLIAALISLTKIPFPFKGLIVLAAIAVYSSIIVTRIQNNNQQNMNPPMGQPPYYGM